ncbi:hypothetical protein BDQ17DRAFT_365019 [Cyathus striatus]|nr:hypothetical protein BDQ17DRAFT_365019 [Cyathus striatus]
MHLYKLKFTWFLMFLRISATLQAVFANAQTYDYFVLKFSRADLFILVTYSAIGKYVTIYFTAFVAQMFYATRIYSIIQGVAAAACDISITLSFSLIVKANRSGMRSRTHNLLNKLIVYAVNRAAATSVCSLLGVSMFWYISGTYYYMIPLVANTHIYVISVISVLSTRGALREEDYSIHLSDIYIPSNSVDNRHGRYVPKETEADLQKAYEHVYGAIYKIGNLDVGEGFMFR